jgi:hypothetical protein
MVAVRDHNELIGLAPFYVEARRAHVVDYRLPGVELWSRLAPLATPGREAEVATAIGDVLANAVPQPASIALEGAPLASRWSAALRDGWPGPMRPLLRQYHVYGCPTVTLVEDDFDAWLAAKSSNFRQQMRRHRRRFLAAGGTERMSSHRTARADIETLLRLHALRWENLGRSDLVALGGTLGAMLEDVGRELLDQHRFRLRVLEIEGEPICAQLFLVAGDRILYFNGGWDERFAHLKPSLLGIFSSIEEAFVRGERHIDLGPGEQAYKLRFANGSDPVAWSVLIVPSRRLPLTYARMLPALIGGHAREGARRALGEQRTNDLRRFRARLRR